MSGDDCTDDCPVSEIDEQSGIKNRNSHTPDCKVSGFGKKVEYNGPGEKDTTPTGASDFFYVPKPTRRERDTGLDELPTKRKAQIGGAKQYEEGKDPDGTDDVGERFVTELKNIHPTVKPVDLMRWLVRLVTPPGGIVLDPFMGSGSTGIAAVLEDKQFIGIDMTPEFIDISTRRIGASDQYLALKEPELARRVETGMAKKEATLDDFFS